MDNATDASWVLHLPTLLSGPELAEDQRLRGEKEVVTAIRAAHVSILQFLQPLGSYLTTESDLPRAKALNLLAKVVKDVPETLSTAEDVHYVAEFFIARLNDRPGLRGALEGCLALLDRATLLQEKDVIAMLQGLVDFVFVQSLSAYDREVCFRILLLMMEKYGQAILDHDDSKDLDILEYGLASFDGEKDPRCLIQGFQAMKSIILLYSRQSEDTLASGQLEERVEELFDVLSCYFPVDFTPPPNDQRGITRDDIAKELQNALASSQLYTDLIVPLVTDKLSSLLRPAKLDSLSLLEACVQSYGAAPFKEHVATLWLALRPELRKWGDENEDALSNAAWHCLQACFVAFDVCNDMKFARIVLDDSNVVKALNLANNSAQEDEKESISTTAVRNCTVQLGVLASSGNPGAQLVIQEALVPLLDYLSRGRRGDANALTTSSSTIPRAHVLAWAVTSFLCQQVSTGANALSSGEPRSAWENNVDSLHRLVLLSAELDLSTCELQGALRVEGAELEEDGEEKVLGLLRGKAFLCSPYDVVALQMKTLKIILSNKPTAKLLRQSDASTIVNALVPIVKGKLGSNLCRVAISLLQLLAVGPHKFTIETEVIPRLLETRNSHQPIKRQAALEAISCLAGAAPSLMSLCMAPLADSLLIGLDNVSQGLGQSEYDVLVDIADNIAILLQLVFSGLDGLYQTMISSVLETSSCLVKHIYLDYGLSLPHGHLADFQIALIPKLERIVYLGTAISSAKEQMLLSARAISELASRSKVSGNSFSIRASYYVLMALSPESCDAIFNKSEDMDRLWRMLIDHAVIGGELLAADSLGSILNKLGHEEGTDNVAQRILDALRVQNYIEKGKSINNIKLMTAIVHALAMRGSKKLEDFLSRLVNDGLIACLRRSEAEAMDYQHLERAKHNLEYMCECAEAFGDVVHEEGLSKEDNAVTTAYRIVRPLWQQRTFVLALKSLTRALHETPVNGQSVCDRSALLTLALARVLVNVPSTILHVHASDATIWVIHCLTMIVSNNEELYGTQCHILKTTSDALLKALFELLDTKKGRQEAGLGLSRLVPALVSLAEYQHAMQVREYSFRCLIRISAFPYNELFPYKKKVLGAAAKGTDDKKRRVRKVAVACREAWMQDITPNNDVWP